MISRPDQAGRSAMSRRCRRLRHRRRARRPDRGLLPDQRSALRPRHRARSGLCRRHQPHRRLQGLPVRHRRPPLLLQIEGGRRAVAGDPARRFHYAAAAVAHLLQRQILLLSAQGLRSAAQARRVHQRGVPCCPTPTPRSSPWRQRAPSTNGCATSSASGCSRFSSRPTPRRCGACRATRFPPTGRRSASRASIWPPPSSTGSSARCGAGRKAGGRADGDTVKTLIESFQYPRKGPGMMWEAAARKIKAQGGRILMGRELVALEFDAAAQLLAHRGRRGGRRA